MKNFLVILSFAMCFSSHAQYWQSPGPGGGRIHSYLVFNDYTLVGTSCGIYRTDDGGAYFYAYSQGMPSGRILSMINDDGVLIACIESKGLYRSTDNGVTWTLSRAGNYLRQDGFGQQKLLLLNNMCVARNYDDFNDSLYFSDDSGLTWQVQAVDNSLFNNLISAGGSLYMFSQTFGIEAGLYKSTDLGASWEFSGDGLAVDTYPADIYEIDGILYLLSDYVYSSSDDGLSWQQESTTALPSLYGDYNFVPQWTLFDGDRFYAQNGGNIYIQVASWMPGEAGWEPSTEIPSAGNTWTFYMLGETPCLSRQEGQFRKESSNWQPYIINGINGGQINGLFGSGNECLSTSSVEMRSLGDNESAWNLYNPTNVPDVDYSFYSIARIDEHLLMGKNNAFGVLDIMHSVDNGASWEVTGLLELLPDARFLVNQNELLVYGSAGGYPFVFGVNENGVFTTDYLSPYGYTFDDSVVDLVVYEGDLYALTTSYEGQLSKVLKWDLAAGTFWQLATDQIDGNFFGAYCLTSWQDDLFMGLNVTEDWNGGVMRSPDNGVTWEDIGIGLEGIVVNRLLPSGDSLFAATNAGVYMLANGSSTWENLSGNLISGDVIDLARTDWYLYALLADGGAWRLGLSDEVGIAAQDAGKNVPGIFPNPGNDFLYVKGLKNDFYRITWHDLQGRLIKQDLLEDVSRPINTADLKPGIYQLQLESETTHFAFSISIK